MTMGGEENKIGQLPKDEIDALVKIGMVDVVGISDDGQWVYSLSDLARSITTNLDLSNPGWLIGVMDAILKKLESDE